MINIKPPEMKSISSFVLEHCGIVLDDSKAYLVENRLTPLLEEMLCSNYDAFLEKVRHDSRLSSRLIDAITTNETSFFRDKKPFELFSEKILPDLTATHCRERLRVWSAACSTGQEAYSLGMLMMEFQRLRMVKTVPQIFGTDIADSVLKRAKKGRFSRHEVARGVPPLFLERYFRKEEEGYTVIDPLKDMAFFHKINLLKPFKEVGKFDVIFCRNVAIYFGIKDRQQLFTRLLEQLQPWGILVLGSTESLFGISDQFIRKEWNQIAYYQLPESVFGR